MPHSIGMSWASSTSTGSWPQASTSAGVMASCSHHDTPRRRAILSRLVAPPRARKRQPSSSKRWPRGRCLTPGATSWVPSARSGCELSRSKFSWLPSMKSSSMPERSTMTEASAENLQISRFSPSPSHCQPKPKSPSWMIRSQPARSAAAKATARKRALRWVSPSSRILTRPRLRG